MAFLGAIFVLILLVGIVWLIVSLIRKHGWKKPAIAIAVGLVGFIVSASLTGNPTYAGVEVTTEQKDNIAKLVKTESDIASDVSSSDQAGYNKDVKSYRTTYKALVGKDFSRENNLSNAFGAYKGDSYNTAKSGLGSAVFVWAHGDVAAKITGKTSGKDYKAIINQMYKDY
ncbi:hypothetical protein [Lacticaseibacillus brantae]|uniref:Uncharacterized protein n=1 Tax=Lacticaseibacillus brantae DSM 23927 TaxID=1423727 RepID=A0A0R2B512_9LACO|nr:hypothetical protein [Lacticaseibacillus brantae]KRM73044.1 hypothetical protein FC34_GL000765 [Lacticaseibacillus brantae DSM 23927]